MFQDQILNVWTTLEIFQFKKHTKSEDIKNQYLDVGI